MTTVASVSNKGKTYDVPVGPLVPHNLSSSCEVKKNPLEKLLFGPQTANDLEAEKDNVFSKECKDSADIESTGC